MKKPVEAIERLRAEINSCVDIRRAMTLYSAHAAILAYLDSLHNWPEMWRKVGGPTEIDG